MSRGSPTVMENFVDEGEKNASRADFLRIRQSAAADNDLRLAITNHRQFHVKGSTEPSSADG